MANQPLPRKARSTHSHSLGATNHTSPKRHRSGATQGGRPAPVPAKPTSLVDCLRQNLGIDTRDEYYVVEEANGLGAYDTRLGDRVVTDCCTLVMAAESPLSYTPPLLIPLEGEYSWYASRMMILPSGRVIQIQRRYASSDELDRYLEAGTPLAGPSVHVREILIDGYPQKGQVELMESGTILPTEP